jgi:hypothetical protein
METIFVQYHPMSVPVGSAFHKYISYTNSEGVTYQIHGGGDIPVGDPKWAFISDQLGDNPFGDVQATAYQRSSFYEDSVVIKQADDLSGEFLSMLTYAENFQNKSLEYDALRQNSNTLVDYVLSRLGYGFNWEDAYRFVPGSYSNTGLFDGKTHPLRDDELKAALSSVLTEDSRIYGEIFGDLVGAPKCFPAHTRIQTSRTTSTAISALRVGDVVLAFDARADRGRGALVPRRVVRLYRNTTTDWLRLRWVSPHRRTGDQACLQGRPSG